MHSRAHPSFTPCSVLVLRRLSSEPPRYREPFSPSHLTKAIVPSKRDAARIIALSTRRELSLNCVTCCTRYCRLFHLRRRRLRRLRHSPFSVKTRGIPGREIRFSYFKPPSDWLDCLREALVPEIVFCGKLENKILERKGAEEPFREFLAGG